MSDQNDSGQDKIHDKIWYVKKGKKVFGPFAAAKIRNLLMDGKIDLRDEVSRDKQNWTFLLSQPEVVPLQMRDPDAMRNTDITDELDPGRKGSLWLPIVIVSVLVIGGIMLAMMAQENESAKLPDCAAGPAPGIIWNSCNKRSMKAENVNLDGLEATNVILNGAKLSGSTFKNANMRYAQLESADLSYCDFSAASLKGANLHRSDLTNVVFDGADLRYADFSDAQLGGVSLQQAQLSGAVWIDGNACKPGSVGKCIQ